ncbi:MAG: UdgX family uracil-DNA binding protein [Actinomycetota bacterium]|nr:UdgX family uracil-DNA binding protein [Actinomycetota bacterium]
MNRARTLDQVRSEAATCTNCELYKLGTQTVFGEGAAGSDVMLVGEQPGDREDRAGRPFVGPAGQLLDRALAQAGIDRSRAYVTNAVKHFKWRPAGKVRLHQKPNAEEIQACRPWLELELELVGPQVVVCLGATAAQALLGRSFKVTRQRGQFVAWPYAPLAMATIHPSAILRVAEPDDREAAFAGLVADLGVAAGAVAEG